MIEIPPKLRAQFVPPDQHPDDLLRGWHRAIRPFLIGIGPEASAECTTVFVALTLWGSGHHLLDYDIASEFPIRQEEVARDMACLLRRVADDIDPDAREAQGIRAS